MGPSELKAGGVGCRFADALDHVWYDRDRLAVRREIPVPSETELQGLIPSERFPSDHLSVRDSPLGSAEMPDPGHHACPDQLCNILERPVTLIGCITSSLPCRWYLTWSGRRSSQQMAQHSTHP